MKTQKLSYVLSSAFILCAVVACRPSKMNSNESKRSTPEGSVTSLTSTVAIVLANQGADGTIVVSNPDLSVGGNLAVRVDGLTDANLILGMTEAPVDVFLAMQNNQRVISGKIGTGDNITTSVTFLARDKSKCTGTDCAILPDAKGKFPSTIVFNPNYDVKANFKIQYIKSDAVDPSWYEKLKIFFANGAVNFLETMKVIFQSLGMGNS